MVFAETTLDRVDQRVADLCRRFDLSLDHFDELQLFTGPSIYFHRRAIARRRDLATIQAAASDRAWCELVYATLAAWGMHRMGPINAKLTDFEPFAASLAAAGRRLVDLDSAALGRIDDRSMEGIADRLWHVIEGLDVGLGSTKLVAGSKALHHLLPDLLPPMDREYTLMFFFEHKTIASDEEARFLVMLESFNRVARECRGSIERRLGRGMHTSTTKVLDNAVVGYVRAMM